MVLKVATKDGEKEMDLILKWRHVLITENNFLLIILKNNYS